MKKRYCLKCQHKLKDDICSKCHFDNDTINLASISSHEIKRLTYLQLKKVNTIINQSYSFLIVGLIFLIIAAFFFGLSFRYDVIGARVFTPTSMEFIVSMITLCLSFVLLIAFAIKFSYAFSRKRYFNYLLSEEKKTNAQK